MQPPQAMLPRFSMLVSKQNMQSSCRTTCNLQLAIAALAHSTCVSAHAMFSCSCAMSLCTAPIHGISKASRRAKQNARAPLVPLADSLKTKQVSPGWSCKLLDVLHARAPSRNCALAIFASLNLEPLLLDKQPASSVIFSL
jgi:hypothetical protein